MNKRYFIIFCTLLYIPIHTSWKSKRPPNIICKSPTESDSQYLDFRLTNELSKTKKNIEQRQLQTQEEASRINIEQIRQIDLQMLKWRHNRNRLKIKVKKDLDLFKKAIERQEQILQMYIDQWIVKHRQYNQSNKSSVVFHKTNRLQEKRSRKAFFNSFDIKKPSDFLQSLPFYDAIMLEFFIKKKVQ